MIKAPQFTDRRIRTVNLCLAALVILINGYILISPLWPQFDLWKRKHQAAAVAGLPYKTKLDKDSSTQAKRAEVPSDNRLIVPKLALNEHIYTGRSPYLVNQGVWARPNTSIPPKGSNTVMVAHRFTYSGPATFYSLDKMTNGDKIVIYWQKKEYDYTVTDVKVVPPTATEVENPTSQSQLTLYTCTPLWSAKNRLIVVAKLDQGGRP